MSDQSMYCEACEGNADTHSCVLGEVAPVAQPEQPTCDCEPMRDGRTTHYCQLEPEQQTDPDALTPEEHEAIDRINDVSHSTTNLAEPHGRPGASDRVLIAYHDDDTRLVCGCHFYREGTEATEPEHENDIMVWPCGRHLAMFGMEVED